MSCAGVKLGGAHRGEQCGARANYAFRGKMYCAAHRTIAAASPGEFTAAQSSMFKRIGRAAHKAMMSKAQIDAFGE